MQDAPKYPGLFRRLFHAERSATSRENRSVREYEVLKRVLPVSIDRIFYPGPSTDISLSRVFRKSTVFYVEKDEDEYTKLVRAKLPKRRTVIIKGSALEEKNQPTNVDILILRNFGCEKPLTESVNVGGYVIVEAWGNSYGASELQSMRNMELVGYFSHKNDTPYFIQRDLDKVAKTLEEDREKKSLFGSYRGDTFVFRKTGNISVNSETEEITHKDAA